MLPDKNNKFLPVLTIAGSDNSGGAGIQADLKTFMALGCYGFSAISAITAQNPEAFGDYEPVEPQMLYKQIQYAVQYAKPISLKTGMLATIENIQITARAIKDFHLEITVIDPVMKSSNGENLASENYVDILKSDLIADCFVITPNRMEAEILSGISIQSYEEVRRAALIIQESGAKNVIIKGGHLDFDMENSVDTLFTGKNWYTLKYKRNNNAHSFHGTGCTFSAALCANLAKGYEIEKSMEYAKKYVLDTMNYANFPGILNHHIS